MWRNTGKCLCFVASVLTLGTAGSSDIHAIPFKQMLVQLGICLIVGGIGFGIIKRTEEA